ncbi:photosystem I assembly protein Ycf3 [Hartmannibacter diazotrophicus]|uniref:Photosystem I assembly protein Ycf3 n=1 Tax=Hartmannibacter diazotrophicus TaxID=1482074 RepID=A0A2C9D467_9HYPH|nr:tetratricopeptide repeat protein [Hartmannibacter diazotrophicus]SON55076.1 photosystem I assembly protein Ycf3 [Hartmannibacter diazotrophicus]
MSIDERLQDGMRAHQKHDFATAIACYKAVLSEDPNHPDAMSLVGLLLAQHGRMDDALEVLEEALRINPDNPYALVNFGNVLMSKRRFDEAFKAYTRANELDPANEEAWANSGACLRNCGRIEDAISVLTAARQSFPKSVTVLHNLAVCHMCLGEHDKAADCLETCLRVGGYQRNPSPMWHITMLPKLGRPELASKVLGYHLSQHPEDEAGQFLLAVLEGRTLPRATDAYIREHFDDFSESFDEVLARIDYQAPQLIVDLVRRLHPDDTKFANVLDLGCGTGLCGIELRPLAERLSGVDLSAGMLRMASGRDLYDSLQEGELVAHLLSLPAGSLDLATCADTLCYFGPLDDFMTAAAHALKPGARLVATVEHLRDEGDDPHRMLLSGRFSHRESHIRDSAQAAGLDVVTIEYPRLRYELGEEIHGLLFCVERPTASA